MKHHLILIALFLVLAGHVTAQNSTMPGKEPVAIDESKLNAQEMKQLTHIRQFADLVHAGKYKESGTFFSQATRPHFTAEYIEHSWKLVVESMGDWKSDVVTETTYQGELFVVIVVCRFENGDVKQVYGSDETPLLAGFRYQLEPPDEFRSLATEFLELVDKEEFEEATNMFDTVMKGLMSAARLKQGSENLGTTYGTFVQNGGMRYSPMPGGIHAITVTLEFERGKVDFILSFNDKKEIAGWMVIPRGQIDVKALAEQLDKEEN